MKIRRLNRNREIDHSLAVGAKAFALGAVLVLVLVLAITHAPSHVAGDPIAYPAFATSKLAQHAPVNARDPRAAAGEAATPRLEAPFTSTVADPVAPPPQF